MRPFFSNGIFTFDAPTVLLIYTLISISTFIVTLTLPQHWIVYPVQTLFIIFEIIVIIAIVKRKKIILDVCFWINVVQHILYTFFCIFAIPSLYHTMNTQILRADSIHGPAKNEAITQYILSTKCSLILILSSWASSFIYLCALNNVRKEFRELNRIAISENGIEKEQSV